MNINLTLPCYFQNSKKKVTLVGMNWYRNAHYIEQNKIKKFYTLLISTLLPKQQINQYEIQYTYFYKNSNSDLMNVCSVIDKFVQDALQAKGITPNDTVKYCLRTSCCVGGQDRNNPRIEVKINKVDE